MQQVSEKYQDFAIIFSEQMHQHIDDRNMNAIHELLDAGENEDGSLSNSDLAFIGIWRSYFALDPETYLWIGYALSVREGFERLLAYFFITAQQQPIKMHG